MNSVHSRIKNYHNMILEFCLLWCGKKNDSYMNEHNWKWWLWQGKLACEKNINNKKSHVTHQENSSSCKFNWSHLFYLSVLIWESPCVCVWAETTHNGKWWHTIHPCPRQVTKHFIFQTSWSGPLEVNQNLLKSRLNRCHFQCLHGQRWTSLFLRLGLNKSLKMPK